MLLSVIIPTHNRAGMVGEAVESVLAQDAFQDRRSAAGLELLVIDDGSTDRTRNVVQSFGERVKYVQQEHLGVSAARNRGLRQSRGDLVAFLDSDDLWMKDKARVQIGYMKAFPQAVACYTEEVWMRNGRRLNPHKKHKKHTGWIFDRVLPLCLLSLSSAMFRRSLFDEIGSFDESLPACEDYDLGIRLTQKYPVHLISKPLIIKRGGHNGQLSRAFSCMDRFRVRALLKALSLDLTDEQRRRVEEEIAKKSRVLAQGYAKRGRSRQAQIYRELIEKYGRCYEEET